MTDDARQPDLKAAADFLDVWHGSEPRHLTAIVPDHGNQVSRTFAKDEHEQLTRWCDEQQRRGAGLYYHVNVLNGSPRRGKANKNEVHTLVGMAYFCLTVLEQAAGGRPAIPGKFGISSTVLKMLGGLTGGKGGSQARKSVGRSHELIADERNWIEQATKRLIRRVAEVAHDPLASTPLVTMGDLPKL